MKKLYIYFIFISAIFSACKRERKNPEWTAEYLIPLASSNLNITKIIPDSLKKINADNSVSVIFNQTLFDTSVKDLVKIRDTTIKKSFHLSDMTLSDNSFSQSISLGQICEKGGVTGATIIANQGDSLAVPSMSVATSNSNTIDAGSLFESADILSGTMDVTLTNNFPIDMTDFIFSLRNSSDSTIIALDTFAILTANGGSATHNISLAGKKVEGKLLATILHIASPGTGLTRVPIDTAQKSIVTITVHNLKVSNISAIFPSRTLAEFDNNFKLDLAPAEIHFVKIGSGILNINAISILPATMKINLSNPLATLNGNSLQKIITIPAGVSGIPSVSNFSIDFSDYDIDMRGTDFLSYNTLLNHLKVSVDSTGILQKINAGDSIEFSYEFKNVKLKYAKGYFGTKNQKIGPGKVSTNIFKKIISGNLNLEKTRIYLSFQNGIGVDAVLNIDSISSFSSFAKTVLIGTTVSNSINIGRAQEKPYRPVVSTMRIDENNSNITSLIQSFPSQFNYSFTGIINPFGNQWNYKDFFYDTSRIKATLQLEIPLSFSSDQLTLIDTVSFSPGDISKYERVKSGFIKLNTLNGYPLEAKVSAILLDGHYNVVDSIFSANTQYISAGILDTKNPSYVAPTASDIKEYFDDVRLKNFSKVKFAKFIVSFTTQPSNTKIQIYDNWNFALKLSADVKYRNGGK